MTDVDDARIELFLERAAVLRSSRAAASIDETAMTVKFGSGSSKIEVEITAPDDEATLAYFTRIREFDTPGNPFYVPDFFLVLTAGASPRRLQVVDWLRAAHADLGREPYDRSSHVLGPGATPRQVWELWTYSQIIHSNASKRATWASLDTYQQGAAKFVAYGYAADLFHVVTVAEAMLRDRTLDDRGVRGQVLTFDPRLAGDLKPAIEAAKIRLR
jgi:hypothetical protein